MTTRTTCITTSLIAASLATVFASGAAQAALQGRDLNGSAGSFEAYYDTVLDITWLADANYAKTSGYDADGRMTWAAANTWAANLSFTDAVNNITYADWRLPAVNPVDSISPASYVWVETPELVAAGGDPRIPVQLPNTQREMGHLHSVTLGNSGLVTPAGRAGCWTSVFTNNCFSNVGPFTNFQAASYWSATSDFEDASDYSFSFSFSSGILGYSTKTYGLYALAVSPGDVANTAVTAVPEADTWAMLLAGLGLVGAAARRRFAELLSTSSQRA